MSDKTSSEKTAGPDEHSVHNPDDVIIELGGCGRFQIRIAILVHVIKTVCCWSTISIVYITATPRWRCADDPSVNETNGDNVFDKACFTANGSKCVNFEFDPGMNTIVSEWGLVCDKDWIPSTWSTISMIVNIFGYVLAGHLADTFGRKAPFFMSVFIMMVFNLVTYFSVSWVMFAAVRVFVGIGASFFLTIQYSYLSEFMLSRWRSWFIGFPSWPIQGCVMALILWLLRDWRNFHLATAALCLPFFAAWWFMPESFRWYYSHDRVQDAERVVNIVAKINHRPLPDMAYMKQAAISGSKSTDKKYSLVNLFSSRALIKLTTLMVIVWFAIGIIEMGIMFGIQNLAGNFYLNTFLFRVVQIPSKSLGIWLQNRFGRRKTTMLVYVVTGAATLAVGIVQYIDTDKRDELTTGFALVTNLAMEAAWGPLQTMTVELYPTVIRNIGFSFCAIIAHVGAAVGPQLVHLETSIPGIMYFTCGGLAVIGCCALIGLPETNNENLVDKLKLVSAPSHTSHFDMNISNQDMSIGILDPKKDKKFKLTDKDIENGVVNPRVDKDDLEIKTISKGI